MTGGNDPEAPWRILGSELAYDGTPWIRVFRDRVQTGSGQIVDDFHRVDAIDFALVFALDEAGDVILVRQWRQGPRQFAFCFPGGHIDQGETPEIAARREFLEETGYEAHDLTALGRFCMHSNLGLGWGHFFHAGTVSKSDEGPIRELETIAPARLSPKALSTAMTTHQIVTVHDALCAQLGLSHIHG